MQFKLLMTAAAVAMAFGSVQAAVQNGTFEGSANGRSGPVTTQVTFQDGKIVDVKVVKDGESAMISDVAKERVPAAIVKNQSTVVDSVTGASLTSRAIMAGATQAVKAAGGEPRDF